MEVDGAVSVFDVWDSVEQFQKFGETLLPLMKKLGADPGQPQIMKVHNLKERLNPRHSVVSPRRRWRTLRRAPRLRGEFSPRLSGRAALSLTSAIIRPIRCGPQPVE